MDMDIVLDLKQSNKLDLLLKVLDEYTYYDTYYYNLHRDFSSENDKSKRWLVIMTKLPETIIGPLGAVSDNTRKYSLYLADILKIVKIIDIYNPHIEIKQIITKNRTHTSNIMKYVCNEIVGKSSETNIRQKIECYMTIKRAFYARDMPKNYTGNWITWTRYGSKLSERSFKNGKKDGLWVEFDMYGKIILKQTFKNGRPTNKQ